jgi:hypothetical protein
MVVQFDNLFGGKTPQLSEVVHNFVNKEPKQFIQDFKPEIIKQASPLVIPEGKQRDCPSRLKLQKFISCIHITYLYCRIIFTKSWSYFLSRR